MQAKHGAAGNAHVETSTPEGFRAAPPPDATGTHAVLCTRNTEAGPSSDAGTAQATASAHNAEASLQQAEQRTPHASGTGASSQQGSSTLTALHGGRGAADHSVLDGAEAAMQSIVGSKMSAPTSSGEAADISGTGHPA